MNSYYFDKKINLEEAPDKVNSVLLENSFDYVRLDNGVHVSGKIGISGECKCQEHTLPFVDTLDVDLIVPSENIGSLKSLKLIVDNYDCHIVDDSLNFRIKCSLSGYDEDKENFEVEKAFKDFASSDQEKLVQEFRDTLTEEEQEKLANLMDSDVEVFISNNKEETTMPLEEEKMPEIQETVSLKNNSNETKDEKTDDEESVHPFVPYEEEPFEVESFSNNETIEKIITESKNVKPNEQESPKHHDLFSSERFVVFSRFYRCLSNDTYEVIAAKYNLNPYDLRDLNKNKEISEGTLIQIPR